MEEEFENGIDPLTGLPIEKEDTEPIEFPTSKSTPVFDEKGEPTRTEEPADPFIDSLSEAAFKPYNDSEGFENKYRFDIDVDAYKDYLGNVKPWLGTKELDTRRAENQSNWSQAGNAVVRTVGGAVLDFVGGTASMLDFEDYFNQDDEVGNWLTDLTEEGKQGMQKSFPIYRENPEKAFDIGDAAWWFENGSALVSSVAAFGAQGMLLGGGLGNLAKGLSGQSAKWVQQVLQGGANLTTAAGLNQAEAIMEAGSVYKDNYAIYKQRGATEEEAKAKAAQDASDVVNINRANILLNLTGASMFTRMGAQNAFTREIRKAPSKFFSTETGKKILSEGGQEFLEEQINYIAGESGRSAVGGGRRKSLIDALRDGQSMSRYANDAHFWESGVLGAVGGIGQGVTMQLTPQAKKRKKAEQEVYDKQQARIAELDAIASSPESATGSMSDLFMKAEDVLAQAELMTEAKEAYLEAVANGDQAIAEEKKKEIQELSEGMLHKQTYASLEDGTTEHLINAYKRFADLELTEAQRKQKELPADYKERAREAVEYIENLEKAYVAMETKPEKTREQAFINRTNAHKVSTAIREAKEFQNQYQSEMDEIRGNMNSKNQVLSDEELAYKNKKFKQALEQKRAYEMLEDGLGEKMIELDNEYAEELEKNVGKKARKKLTPSEKFQGRQADAYREKLQDDIINGNIDVFDLQNLRNSINRSSHPNKNNFLKAIDGVLELAKKKRSQQNRSNVKRQAKRALDKVLDKVDQKIVDTREELGLDQKETERLKKLRKKKEQRTKKEKNTRKESKRAQKEIANAYKKADSLVSTEEEDVDSLYLNELEASLDKEKNADNKSDVVIQSLIEEINKVKAKIANKKPTKKQPQEDPEDFPEANPTGESLESILGINPDGTPDPTAGQKKTPDSKGKPTSKKGKNFTEDEALRQRAIEIEGGIPNKTMNDLSEERVQQLSEPTRDMLLTDSQEELELMKELYAEEGVEEISQEEAYLIAKRERELFEFEEALEERMRSIQEAIDSGTDSKIILGANQLHVEEIKIDDVEDQVEQGYDYESIEDSDSIETIATTAEEDAELETEAKKASHMDSVPDDAISTIDSQHVKVTIKNPTTDTFTEIPVAEDSKGLFIEALDSNGNPLKKPATKYSIKKESSVTAEDIASGKAVPLFWYPVKTNPGTGKPMVKKGYGMSKFLYNKSEGALTTVKSEAMAGEDLYIYYDEVGPDGKPLLEEDVIAFEDWVDHNKIPKDGKVYLKKNQYVYPSGPLAGQPIYLPIDETTGNIDYTQEIITVHLTPDGPPVQKISKGDTDLRRNFDSYTDENGAVPVRILEKNRGFVINQKTNEGTSAKNPIQLLGERGKDFHIGISKDNKVMYFDGEKHLEVDTTAEDGKIFAVVPSANGKPVPLRLETKNVTREIAESIIDNILLNSDLDGKTKTAMVADIVATKSEHNSMFPEDPRHPVFYVDPAGVKFKMGKVVIYVDHKTNDKGHNNLQRALDGKPFQIRLHESTDTHPLRDFGEVIRKDPKDENSPVIKKMHGAKPDFRELLIEAITAKKHEVSKNKIIENERYIDVATGKNYDSYISYLYENEILTTDVPAGQKFTNSKAHMVPVGKKISLTKKSSTKPVNEKDAVVDDSNNQNEEQDVNVVSETDNIVETATGDPTEKQIEEAAEEKSDNNEIEEEIAEEGDPDDLDSFDIDLREAIDEGQNENPLNILTDTEIDWIINTFGEEHLLTMAKSKYVMVKGEKAYGAYTQGIIILSEQGVKGTAYHEAFHLVMDLMLTPEQKNELMVAAQATFDSLLPGSDEYNKLAKRYPKKSEFELQEIYLEEQMAEAFRTFMESEESEGKIKKTKVGRAIQKFFDMLRKAILKIRIFGTTKLNPDSPYLHQGIMKRTFLNIKTGKFQLDDRTKASLNKTKADILQSDNIMLRRKDGFGEVAKHDYINNMRYALINKIFRKYVNEGKAPSIEEVLTNPKYKDLVETGINEVRELFRNHADTKLKPITQQTKNPKAAKTAKIWSNTILKGVSDKGWFDEIEGGVVINPGFKSLLVQSLQMHGSALKIRNRELFTNIEKETNEDLKLGEEIVEEEPTESTPQSADRIHDQHFAYSDPKKGLAFEVKVALSFIPKPNVKEIRTINGKEVMVTVSSNKSSYTGLPVFIDFHKAYSLLASKLADVPIKNMEQKLIEIGRWNPDIKAIYEEYKKWDKPLQNKFKSTMSKTQLKFSTVVAGANQKMEVIETNRAGVIKQITNEWERNRNDRDLFEEQDGKEDLVNKKTLQELADKYEILSNRELQKNSKDYFNTVQDVFSYVGITFEPPVLQMLISKYDPTTFHKEYTKGIFKFILEDLGYDSKRKKIKKSPGVNPYLSKQGKGQTKGISKLAELVKDMTTDLYTGTFVNGEGKMVYSINLNSYIHKFKALTSTPEGIETLKNKFAGDLYYNPEATGSHMSIFLKLLTDSNNSDFRTEFDIVEIDTYKEKRKADGTPFTEMGEKEAWLTRMAMFDNNSNKKYTYISLGTKSDKGRSLYMKVPLLGGHLKEMNAPLPSGDLTQDEITNLKANAVKRASVHLLYKNAFQEYARIQKAQKDLFGKDALPDSELIENYHYSGTNEDGSLNRSKANALRFMSIPDLNFSNYGLFDKNGKLKKLDDKGVQKMHDAIDAFVDREVLRSKERMVKSGVAFEKDGKYYSDAVHETFGGKPITLENGDKAFDIDQRLNEFLMNELVWRTEMNKYQMGDLAFYKTKTADITNNPEFGKAKGTFISVVTDAGKRSYQSITPGIDHVIDDEYGKPEVMNMAVMKDIYSIMSVEKASILGKGIAGNPKFAIEKYINDAKMKELSDMTPAQKRKEWISVKKELTMREVEAVKIARIYRKGSNTADAQGYTTLDAHRRSMMSNGTWTQGPKGNEASGETHEAAYQMYWNTDKPITEWPQWAKNLALKPLKTFYWGYQFDPILKMNVFKQIKHSTVPLYPAFTKFTPSLEKLRQRMELSGEYAKGGSKNVEGKLQPIDVVNLESAVKVGKKGVNEYDSNGNYLENMTVQPIMSEHERAPFILPTDKETDPKDGSQFVKLIISNMPEGADYTTVEGFKSIKTEVLKDVNNKVYEAKIKKAAKKLEKQLGIDQLKENDPKSQLEFLKRVQKQLLEQIEARELPDNYSLALEIQKLEDGTYDFAMPLSFPAYAKKFEIAIAALYKSRVLTQRLPGDQAVQVAEYGIEANNLKYVHYDKNGNLLPAECAISYKQALKLGISKYIDKNTFAIDEKKMIKDGVDPKVLEIIGYRIPTQGKSSTIPLKVKRVLPDTAKGQIMLPHEITTQTGSDYDVDKMFLYYPALEKNKEGKIQKVPVSEKMKQIAEGKLNADTLSDNEIQNMLFAIRFGILTSEHNSMEVINPLDSDTYPDKMKEYAEKKLLEDTATFNYSSGYTDMHLEMVNKDAKALVGIFSSHSVAQAISQDVNIITTTPAFIQVTDINGNEFGTKSNPAADLRGIYGFDGVLRSIYTNENQNASLDNAKDPITGSLNINTFTANVVAYLNRLGYNNDIAVDFVNQPIIRLLTKEKNLEGPFADVKTLATQLKKAYGLNLKGNDGKAISYRSSAKNRIKITPSTLKKALGKDISEMSGEELQHQAQVLADFVKYHSTGADLAKANKMMAPDRFVQMSGLSDIEIWKNNKAYIESENSSIQVLGLYTSKDEDGNTIQSSVPRINSYYENAILGAEKLLSTFMPYNSSYFSGFKQEMAAMLHSKDDTFQDKRIIERINADIINYLMFEKDSPLKRIFSEDSKNSIKNKLFSKNKGVANQLQNIKRRYNLHHNTLLRMIEKNSMNDRNTLQMVSFNNMSSYSADTKTSFEDAFEELYFHPERVVKEKRDPVTNKISPLGPKEKVKAVAEVRALMENLVQYSVLTSGFQTGPNSFIDIIPISFWKRLGEDVEGDVHFSFTDYLRNNINNRYRNSNSIATTEDAQIANMMEQILRNRFTYKNLVKTVDVKNDGLTVLKKLKEKGGKQFPRTFVANRNTSSNFINESAAKNWSQYANFPQYVKMFDKGNQVWRLYKVDESPRSNTTADRSQVEYKFLPSLGEENKFNEFYPMETAPTSIHPDNTNITDDLKEKGTKKKKTKNYNPIETELISSPEPDSDSNNDTYDIEEVEASDSIESMIPGASIGSVSEASKEINESPTGPPEPDFSKYTSEDEFDMGDIILNDTMKKEKDDGNIDDITCGIPKE